MPTRARTPRKKANSTVPNSDEPTLRPNSRPYDPQFSGTQPPPPRLSAGQGTPNLASNSPRGKSARRARRMPAGPRPPRADRAESRSPRESLVTELHSKWSRLEKASKSPRRASPIAPPHRTSRAPGPDAPGVARFDNCPIARQRAHRLPRIQRQRPAVRVAALSPRLADTICATQHAGRANFDMPPVGPSSDTLPACPRTTESPLRLPPDRPQHMLFRGSADGSWLRQSPEPSPSPLVALLPECDPDRCRHPIDGDREHRRSASAEPLPGLPSALLHIGPLRCRRGSIGYEKSRSGDSCGQPIARTPFLCLARLW